MHAGRARDAKVAIGCAECQVLQVRRGAWWVRPSATALATSEAASAAARMPPPRSQLGRGPHGTVRTGIRSPRTPMDAAAGGSDLI